jgi:SagB-type dehydrogenase family enzyme
LNAALEYHHATNVPAEGTDEEPDLDYANRPHPFKDFREAEPLPLEASVAGPLLEAGAGIVRAVPTRSGRTVYFRAYSSAGALQPVDAYVAAPEALYAFDPLQHALIALRGDDVRSELAEAAAAPELATADAVVVLTGIHARTGWKYGERGYRHVWWDAGTMLANLLALAAARGLDPRLHVGFVDAAVNGLLGVDGRREYALALLALPRNGPAAPRRVAPAVAAPAEAGPTFPVALAAHEASALADPDAVRAWRSESVAHEPQQPAEELERAIRRRGSVREYAAEPLPRAPLESLLEWAEAPIPADAEGVVRQVVTVAAVEGLEPGVYDAELELVRAIGADELRPRVGYAAMEQEHPRDAAVNVFQLTDVGAVVERLGDRGYRWAQVEAGIRAGRLQVGAFIRGWGAAASTFYDDEVSALLETREAPLLMVAIGPRQRGAGRVPSHR